MAKRRNFKKRSSKNYPPLTEVKVNAIQNNEGFYLEFFGYIDGNASEAQATDCFDAAKKFSLCALRNYKPDLGLGPE